MIGSIISIGSLLSTDFLLIFSIESVVGIPWIEAGAHPLRAIPQKRGSHKQFMSAEILILTWSTRQYMVNSYLKKKHLGTYNVNNVLS